MTMASDKEEKQWLWVAFTLSLKRIISSTQNRTPFKFQNPAAWQRRWQVGWVWWRETVKVTVHWWTGRLHSQPTWNGSSFHSVLTSINPGVEHLVQVSWQDKALGIHSFGSVLTAEYIQPELETDTGYSDLTGNISFSFCSMLTGLRWHGWRWQRALQQNRQWRCCKVPRYYVGIRYKVPVLGTRY